MIDFHFHSHFSGDSVENPENAIRQAIKQGLKIICFTDHHDYDYQYSSSFSLDFDTYFASLNLLKAQYKEQITVLIGVELGLQVHLNDYFKDLLKRYPFDFVVGSTHVVNGIDPYFREAFFKDGTKETIYQNYLEAIYNNLLATDQFDSVGHLDYIIRYGIYEDNALQLSEYHVWIDKILELIIAKGKSLEINGSGLRYGLNQPHPHFDIVKRYLELGGRKITIGSDAHKAEDIGVPMNQIISELSKMGVTELTYYEKRIEKKFPINNTSLDE